MDKNTLRSTLVIGLAVALLGCQSGPRLAWWKSDEKPEDTSLVARTAPATPGNTATATLPSQQVTPQTLAATSGTSPAKSTSVAATAPAQVPGVPPSSATTLAGAAVANYTANNSAPPSAPPSSGAPAYYAPSVGSSVAASSTTAPSATPSATSGPYDPSRYAAPAASVAATPDKSESIDRYASAPSDRYGAASGGDESDDRYPLDVGGYDLTEVDAPEERYSAAASTASDDRYDATADRYATGPPGSTATTDRYATTNDRYSAATTAEADPSTTNSIEAANPATANRPDDSSATVAARTAKPADVTTDRYAMTPSTPPANTSTTDTDTDIQNTRGNDGGATAAADRSATSSLAVNQSAESESATATDSSTTVATVKLPAPAGQYRPGGTATYSGPQIDIATRPDTSPTSGR